MIDDNFRGQSDANDGNDQKEDDAMIQPGWVKREPRRYQKKVTEMRVEKM